MNILIIGGTIFLGRALVESALAHGHTITLFNRGISFPDYNPGVNFIKGDRKEDLTALLGLQFDAVIDTCGYIPRIVQQSCTFFADTVKNYTFISTLSVYADNSVENDEQGEIATIDNPDSEDITGESYGPLKALCEQEVLQQFNERAFIVRPGLIVGPHDPTDRFTYWPMRCGMKHSNNWTMLAPGNPNITAWEFIDVRDLAEFVIHGIEKNLQGIFNVTGPRIFAEDIFTESMSFFEHTLNLKWIEEEVLLQKGAIPWSEIPLWVPECIPALQGFHRTNCAKAIDAGLTIRPLHETIQATLEWALSRPRDYIMKAGLSEEREAELLGI